MPGLGHSCADVHACARVAHATTQAGQRCWGRPPRVLVVSFSATTPTRRSRPDPAEGPLARRQAPPGAAAPACRVRCRRQPAHARLEATTHAGAAAARRARSRRHPKAGGGESPSPPRGRRGRAVPPLARRGWEHDPAPRRARRSLVLRGGRQVRAHGAPAPRRVPASERAG